MLQRVTHRLPKERGKKKKRFFRNFTVPTDRFRYYIALTTCMIIFTTQKEILETYVIDFQTVHAAEFRRYSPTIFKSEGREGLIDMKDDPHPEKRFRLPGH